MLWLICDEGKRGSVCYGGCFYTADKKEGTVDRPDKTKGTWDRRDKTEGTVDRQPRWGAGGRAFPGIKGGILLKKVKKNIHN